MEKPPAVARERLSGEVAALTLRFEKGSAAGRCHEIFRYLRQHGMDQIHPQAVEIAARRGLEIPSLAMFGRRSGGARLGSPRIAQMLRRQISGAREECCFQVADLCGSDHY
jgi:hypothetical protein